MLKVEIHFVDGGLMNTTEGDVFWRRLIELQGYGLEGKALIHDLITDDWGPPPRFVHVSGTLEDGTKVDQTIPCR